MKAIWENRYDKLIRAIYTEDLPFVLMYGSTIWEGLENSLKIVLAKISSVTRVYRVEDEDGVIVGFVLIDHKASAVQEVHIRPSQAEKSALFFSVVDAVRASGSGYVSYVLDGGGISMCGFLQATSACNYMPFEFKQENGALLFRFRWSQNWMPIFNITLPDDKIEFRKWDGWLQYKYTRDSVWTNIFRFDEFDGENYVRVPLTVQYAGQVQLSVGEEVPQAVRETSLLFVNGQKRYYPQDYAFAGTVLHWTDQDFSLKPGMEIDLYYRK